MKVDSADSQIAAIAAQSSLVNSSLKQQQLSQEPQQSNTADKTTDKITIRLELPKNTLDTLQKIGNIGDLLISTAKNVRQTNEALSTGAELIDKMKSQLEKIVKQYPPFLQDSKERMDLLKGYSGLQKEITSLMVPQPPAPIYEKVHHLWENLFSGQSHTIQVPQIPSDVPDSHVKAVVKQLDSLKNQVTLVQEAMGNTIKGI